MDLGQWSANERYSHPTRGGLRSCPSSVDVTLALDGMNVTWTKRVPISSRR
ncbi:MAG: hypothetical protein IT457_14265 [Planctomycetes bacterium]|nr:hypothetical protein [Planctomycetota bacterium]